MELDHHPEVRARLPRQEESSATEKVASLHITDPARGDSSSKVGHETSEGQPVRQKFEISMEDYTSPTRSENLTIPTEENPNHTKMLSEI